MVRIVYVVLIFFVLGLAKSINQELPLSATSTLENYMSKYNPADDRGDEYTGQNLSRHT